MCHAPVHLAAGLGPERAVHRAPFGIADFVFRRPVQYGVPRGMAFFEIVRIDVAGMEETEMRCVDIALQALQPVGFAHQQCDGQILFRDEQCFVHWQRRGFGA